MNISIKPLNQEIIKQVKYRFDNLIKPLGSLAKLETMAMQYAGAKEITELKYPDKALLIFEQPDKKLSSLAQNTFSKIFVCTNANEKDITRQIGYGQKQAEVIIAQNFAILGIATPLPENFVVDISPANPEEILAKIVPLTLQQKISSMTGAILTACEMRVPVYVDGVAATLAAYIASLYSDRVKEYITATQILPNDFYNSLIKKLNLSPMLDLNMRVHSGEGAIFAFTFLDAGIKAYREMNTFEEAAVAFELGDLPHKEG